MNQVSRDLFRAVHEGKWISIEYRNKDSKITKYWIVIKAIDLKNKMLTVDGLHLGELTIKELRIYIDSILASTIISGSYCEVNSELVEDIDMHPDKYKALFYNVPNLRVLDYLSDCHRLDGVPYKTDYSLVGQLDGDSFVDGALKLTDEQFAEIVKKFQYDSSKSSDLFHLKQLALNVISINCSKGLYVLAYRKLFLDVTTRSLRAASAVTLCREFSIDGERISINRFIDESEQYCLNDLDKKPEWVKDYITENNPQINGVDDMPYVIAIGMDHALDLDKEYGAIIDMYDQGEITVPLQAFFGEFVKKPTRRKAYPMAFINDRVNLDQLLAINNAMKYPMAYIQGPPGTGKTNTI
ncbi:MAG: hypothetical protein E7423_06160 [Ruminococcaceae bacterium]|nr:hypothetical protein [Oscillospiraceae bacterium]